MFGLTGSHRSGKTTTAKLAAEKMGIEFLETKVGDVLAQHGVDPQERLDFTRRLEIQELILDSLRIQYALRNGAPFIADRTPFDVLAYTQADVQRDSVTPELQDRMSRHWVKALTISQDHLRGVLVLPPLHGLPNDPAKAQPCQFYMDHIFVLAHSLAKMGGEAVGIMVAETLSRSLEHRVEDAVSLFDHILRQEIQVPETKIWTPSS